MTSLAQKVVSRYRLAAFVPDSWFKERKTKLQRILKTPLPRNGLGDAIFGIQGDLIPFFHEFLNDFKELVTQDWARTSVKDRVERAESILGTLADNLKSIQGHHIDASKGMEETLTWFAHIEMGSAFEAKVKTLGDVVKYSWSFDQAKLSGIVGKAVRAMPPEIRALYNSTSDFTPDGRFKALYDFLQSVGFYAATKKLLKRKPAIFEAGKWVDRVYELLKANYTDEALQQQGGLKKFTVNGMTVIIDDRNLRPDDIRAYVKYIDAAYNLLKNKGLQKIWYGTVFIRCESCGGVNQNTGGGVGGNYPTDEDVINIFERPSRYITEILTHELGHRYWYRFMKQPQQERFKYLVHIQGPKKLVVEERKLLTSDAAHLAVDQAAEPLRNALKALRASRLKWTKIGPTFDEQFTSLGRDFGLGGGKVLDAIHKAGADLTVNPEVQGLLHDAIKAASDTMTACFHFADDWRQRVNSIPDGGDIVKWEKDERLKLAAELEQKIDMATASAYVCIDVAVNATNKAAEEKEKQTDEEERLREEQGKTKVAPVSDYGKSNIREAFAEVFTHYVLNRDMTRDQLESFKIVLSSVEGTSPWLVLQRFLIGA